MNFASYGLPNPWLDKCVKSPASEDRSKCKMVNEPKHC